MNSTDALQEALKAKGKSSCYVIPPKYEEIFKRREYDFEYFGMTLVQRGVCFFICLIIGLLSFFYSMLRVLTAVINPASFALPYAFSNFIFFFMFGFFVGFKSYVMNLFSARKRIYSTFFIASTLSTLYSALVFKSYFVNLLLCMVQVISFVVFVITFLPGGTNGVSSMLSLIMRR